jgi:O-antigen/teichoic acid export membrane protein
MPNAFMSWLRSRNPTRYDFVYSLVDQALLSGGSFLVTLVLAKCLNSTDFGRFSAVWAVSVVFESALFKSVLDDPFPSIAIRLARKQRSELRLSVYICSLVFAGGLGGILVLLSGVASLAGQEYASLLSATGFSILAIRMQNAMRRIFYFDRRLKLIVASAFAYSATLMVSVCLLISLGQISASSAMACIGVAATAAFSLVIVRSDDLKRPSLRMVMWSLRRLAHAGRWIVLSGLAFWASSIGIIPIASLLLGVIAGGSLRILFLLFAPMSQVTNAVQSIIIPKNARRLHVQGEYTIRQSAAQAAALFGGMSAAYGIAVVLGGTWILTQAFPSKDYDISWASIAWMALAMTLEGIWLGLAVPLYATGQTRRFLFSRLVAIPFLLGPIPVATWLWGLSGTLAAIALSSATSVVLLAAQVMAVRSDFKPGRGPIAGVVHSEAL